MGVLPLEFTDGDDINSLNLDGSEQYSLLDLNDDLKPQQDFTLQITRSNGRKEEVTVRCRIDTPIEVEYYRHGGILSYVLRQLLSQ